MPTVRTAASGLGVAVVTLTHMQVLMKGCVRLLFQNFQRGTWKEFERGKATL